MNPQLLGFAGLSGACILRASGLLTTLAGSGLPLLRCAPSGGGFDILVSARPDRYAEVHVTPDGEAIVLTRADEYADAVMLTIPHGVEASRARMLAQFIREGILSLDA